MPRIWMLPRDVSSIAGEPNRVAAWASASSWAGPIIPPGKRIRASAPSAASVHLKCAGTGVLVAGAGHQLTVRVALVRDWSSALRVRQ